MLLRAVIPVLSDVYQVLGLVKFLTNVLKPVDIDHWDEIQDGAVEERHSMLISDFIPITYL
jgi:hypothetical protein